MKLFREQLLLFCHREMHKKVHSRSNFLFVIFNSFLGMDFQSQSGRQEISSATSARFLFLTCVPLRVTDFVDSFFGFQISRIPLLPVPRDKKCF